MVEQYFEPLLVGVAIGFVIAFLISLFVKWSLDRFFRNPICVFCVAFWLSVIGFILYVYFDADAFKYHYLFIPFISTITGARLALA